MHEAKNNFLYLLHRRDCELLEAVWFANYIIVIQLTS